jgi:hypothetical protein
MHKYVGVYILLLMYNSSSMCDIENIVENLQMFKKRFIAMKFMYTCINLIKFNSIALAKIKLQKTGTKNCHKNQTSCTMNL